MNNISSSISEVNPGQWDELVANSPAASFFQTRECYDFYSGLQFLEPFVYAISENNKLVGLICGYIIADGNLIKRFFSRRAIVPGGVLLDANISISALKDLLNYCTAHLQKKSIYFEIRNYNDYSTYRSTFQSADFSYLPHLNFHVSTPDVNSALMKLNTTKRRDLKLSDKVGAQWIETKDLNDVKAYFALIKTLYKTKIKTPLFPFEFFEKIVHLSNARLFVVKLNGEIIGGSVCVLLPGRTVYEWFVCGMDGQIKNVFPSTVATWAGIEFAATNGFTRFDMMGAGKPDDSYGVREFKSKFGGQLVEHGRFLYVCKPFLFYLGKKVVKLIKSLK